MARICTILLGLMVALVTTTSGPAVAFAQRPTTTLAIKPDFTRPGGQPGAAREIAPAKPVEKRRRRIRAKATP